MTARQPGEAGAVEEEMCIVRALREAGVNVSSVWDLVKTPQAKAIPVLVDFVGRDLQPCVKEAVIRALSITPAKPIALRPMIQEFRRPNLPDSLRWTIGNALEVLTSEEEAQELLKLATNEQYGTARQMLVVGLGKLRCPQAVDTLVGLLDDEDVQGHAIMALGKLRAVRAKPRIEPFLNSPRAWVRREAKKALERIDKSPTTYGNVPSPARKGKRRDRPGVKN